MISSINVKQIEHQLGIKVKLVARGTLDEERSTTGIAQYNLDNYLEGNKFYYIVRYDDEMGVLSISTYFPCIKKILSDVIHIESFGGGARINVTESDEDSQKEAYFTYGSVISSLEAQNFNRITITLYPYQDFYYSVNDYIEVYELPIILGGEE